MRGGTLRIQILGPLRLWRGETELDAGPRQQAYLLALLVARHGAAISRSDLVDLIWGQDAPDSAINVIHKYMGALRRLLEPALPARGTSAYLLRRGSSYLCAAGPGTLDIAAFRDQLESAQGARESSRPDEALDRYERALQLWHGNAGDGLLHGPDAQPVFARLDDEFFGACTAATDLAVSIGRPERVLAPLRLAASMGPLHEPVQAGLVTALGAAGRQAEALSVYRAVRTRLADELGIDPGPALEVAHQRVLRQEFAPSAQELAQPVEPVTAAVTSPEALRSPRSARTLVGRTAELTALTNIIERAATGGTGLVVVEGEPGAGKTRLMEEATRTKGDRDPLVAWGRCLDGAGAPPMWPWVQIARTVMDQLPAAEQPRWRSGRLGPLLEPSEGVLTGQALPVGNGQFRQFEDIVALLAHAAGQRALVIVLDDLQWADAASLSLLAHLSSRLPPGVAILGSLRDHAAISDAQLARALAAVSRSPVHRRLHLGPLRPHEVAELVRSETGRTPDPEAARTLHERTSGNPFFVQELARLLAGAGRLAGAHRWSEGVPTSVRDVVRDRLAGLDDDARTLLEAAALIGRDVDLTLLAQVADVDVATCLATLEPVQALGLLAPTPREPSSVRFMHDLVRESISATTSPWHATRLHLRVADALESLASGDEAMPERIAHHLWAAGPLAEPVRTSAALVRAGRRAAARSALETAERQFRLAAQLARTAGLSEVELGALTELVAVIGMSSMYADAERELLERAEHLARSLGREVEAAGILYSRWASYAQSIQLDRSGPLARRLLKLGESSSYPVIHTYGLQAWGIHQWDIGNVGEAYRYLSRSEEATLAHWVTRDENPVQHDLQLLMTGLHAVTATLHGRTAEGIALLVRLRDACDDRYTQTVWATLSAQTAVLAGDPDKALDAVEQGFALDPDGTYAFLGIYQRLARCWARALTGVDAAGAADEAERIIEAMLCDPVRTGVSTWYGLLAEMRMTAGELEAAAAALERADHYLRTYRQRYAEGLLLLLRARLLHAQERPSASVHAAGRRAWQVSVEQEAHLFARRADAFLAGLSAPNLQ